MIDNGLLGKVVKTDNYHFIGFLYPNFPFVSHLWFSKADIPGIIYTGGEHLKSKEKELVTLFHSKEYLNKTGLQFISTHFTDDKYDIDLTKRETVLDLVYSNWELDYTQYLDFEIRLKLHDMDKQDFLDFVKVRWLFRDHCIDSKGVGLYNSEKVYKLLNKSVEKVYAEVLAIESNVDLTDLEESLANLILKAKTARNYNPNKTDDYNVTLKSFDNSTKGKEKELTIILSKYRNMSHNKKIKLIWLITELKKQIETGEKHNAD